MYSDLSCELKSFSNYCRVFGKYFTVKLAQVKKNKCEWAECSFLRTEKLDLLCYTFSSQLYFKFIWYFMFLDQVVLTFLVMKISFPLALLLQILFLSAVFQLINGQGGSCEQTSNTTRSQICLTGVCDLQCGITADYSQCDQVCVVEPCPNISCNSSSCYQRCLSGKCNSVECSGDDCTQTCLRNCSLVNCTATSKCTQHCEKGNCGLLASGADVVQNCAENCLHVECKADNCKQGCEGERCGLECSKGKSFEKEKRRRRRRRKEEE